MRKFLTVFLPILITICCLSSPVLAAETAPSYSDVPADAWYVPYIEVCARAGVMGGVGEGRFEPQRPLSKAEAYVLLLRLYDVLQGGDGVFPQPPEDWGTALLTFDDGTQFTLSADTVALGGSSGGTSTYAIFSPEELATLEACVGQHPIITEPATGATARVIWIDSDTWPYNSYNVNFGTASSDFDNSFSFALASFCPDWYRRAAWYARTHGLWERKLSYELDLFSSSMYLFIYGDDDFGPLDADVLSNNFGYAVLELAGNTQELQARLTQCGLSLDIWPAPRNYDPGHAITRAQAAAIIALTLEPELPVVSVIAPLER